LLDKAVEYLANMLGAATVESEDVFIEVCLEVLFLNAALVGSSQPAFQQGRNKMHMRKTLERPLLVTSDRRNPMPIPGSLRAVVSIPIVRVHFGALFNVICYETDQALSRSVRHVSQTNASHFLAIQLDGDYNECFANQLAAAYTRLGSAHIGLINFHRSLQQTAFRSNRCPTKLLQHQPSGLVSHLQFTLKGFRADPGLLRTQQPNRHKPLT